MIGKKLSERSELVRLSAKNAVATVTSVLGTHAENLVRVRAEGARMIACLVLRANMATLRLCEALGLEMKLGGSGVFGLLGSDTARLFGHLPVHQRAWLESPSGPRETKVLLIAGGIALVSLETREGKVTITAVP